MRMFIWVGCIVASAVAIWLAPGLRTDDAGERDRLSYSVVWAEPARQAFGLDKRELWTTSNVKGSPEPLPPYQLVKSYPNLKFTEPLELIAVPGRKAWVVAERGGKIFTFAADRNATEKKLLLDVGHTVYGIALHPKFQTNGYVYVSHVPDTANATEDGSKVSRFTVKDREAMTADPASEKIVLTWPSGGHNGGCLRFGPDGFLYLSTGDGSGIADGRSTGQDI